MATKTVLVTGSSRGIGLALAAHYNEAGWNVIAAARDPANADKLQALNVYRTVQLDVSDESSVQQAAKELDGEAIDLVINNAGMGVDHTFENATKAELVRVFETNTVGPFLISRALLPNLKAAVAANGSATIAQITSGLGSITMNTGEYLNPGYRTSKAALNMLNMVVAHEVKAHKIATVVLCPGFVATDLNGHTGILQPSQSAAMLAKNIADVKLEETGKFISHDGKEYPW